MKHKFKPCIIYCPTQELFNKVLQKIEDESELRWLSGDKPTTKEYYWETEYCIKVSTTDISGIRKKEYVTISAEEFLEEKPTHKYKVGQKVKIKNERCSICGSGVGCFAGENAEIIKLETKNFSGQAYLLKNLSHDEASFCEHNFDLIEEKPKNTFDPKKSFCIYDLKTEGDIKSVQAVLFGKGLEWEHYGQEYNKHALEAIYIAENNGICYGTTNSGLNNRKQSDHYVATAEEFIRDNKVVITPKSEFKEKKLVTGTVDPEPLLSKEAIDSLRCMEMPRLIRDEAVEAIDESVYWHFCNPNTTLTKPTPNKFKNNSKKIMNKVIKFASAMSLSKEEKSLRKAGFKDENGNYTNTAILIILNLKAIDAGFKDYNEMSAKFNLLEDGGDFGISTFEAHGLVIDYKDQLLKTADAYNKEEARK